METFLLELSDIIKKECKKINKEFEKIQKLSYIKSYQCMADCFKKDCKFHECNACSKLCKGSLQDLHDKFILNMNETQEYSGKCVENCINKHGQSLTQNNINCLENCKDTTIEFMEQAKKAYLEKHSLIIIDSKNT